MNKGFYNQTMKKNFRIFALSIVVLIFSTTITLAAATFTNATVSITVASKIISEFAPDKVRVFYECRPGENMTPGPAVCPGVGYFEYIAKYSSTNSKGNVYVAGMIRNANGPLPTTGWKVEVSKMSATNPTEYTYRNIVNIPSVEGSPKISVTPDTGRGTKGGYRLFPELVCASDVTALSCFVNKVWSFSQTLILILAVTVTIIAGVIYMTSGGNPKRVETAKKLIIGALSAVAVIVLGKFFLEKVVGVPWV